jgi:hypothetical protein
VLQSFLLKQNLVPRFEKENGSKRDSEQSHVPSLRQLKVWMTRTEEIFTLPCCFFFRMVAPLDLVELDRLASYDMTLLVQDLDRMFRICQIRVERCHFWQYNIHGCLQTLLLVTVVTLTCMPPSHTSPELGMVQYNGVIAYLSLQISSRPSLVKLLSTRGLPPQIVSVGASYLHSSLGATLRFSNFLGYDVPLLQPQQHVINIIMWIRDMGCYIS